VILTKTQRNDLFQVIESLGLRITEFRLTEHETTEGSRLLRRNRQVKPYLQLSHLPSGMQIYFRHYLAEEVYIEETYEASLFIGPDLKKQMLDSSIQMSWDILRLSNLHTHHLSWGGVITEIQKWLGHLAEFIQVTRGNDLMPDLWDEFQRSRELVVFMPQYANENLPFTSEEQSAISAQINDIKIYIKRTYELSAEQMSQIEERLDAAEESSRRIGRKDWVMAFNGAVFSLILSDLIPQQAAQHILVMALTGLGHLFGIGGVPPSNPPIG